MKKLCFAEREITFEVFSGLVISLTLIPINVGKCVEAGNICCSDTIEYRLYLHKVNTNSNLSFPIFKICALNSA